MKLKLDKVPEQENTHSIPTQKGKTPFLAKKNYSQQPKSGSYQKEALKVYESAMKKEKLGMPPGVLNKGHNMGWSGMAMYAKQKTKDNASGHFGGLVHHKVHYPSSINGALVHEDNLENFGPRGEKQPNIKEINDKQLFLPFNKRLEEHKEYVESGDHKDNMTVPKGSLMEGPQGELSYKKRQKLPKKSFAIPGERSYPINDIAHARNALARVAQHGSPEEKAKIRKAVAKKFPGIEQNHPPKGALKKGSNMGKY